MQSIQPFGEEHVGGAEESSMLRRRRVTWCPSVAPVLKDVVGRGIGVWLCLSGADAGGVLIWGDSRKVDRHHLEGSHLLPIISISCTTHTQKMVLTAYSQTQRYWLNHIKIINKVIWSFPFLFYWHFFFILFSALCWLQSSFISSSYHFSPP